LIAQVACKDRKWQQEVLYVLDGSLTTSEVELTKRVVEHFNNLLSQKSVVKDSTCEYLPSQSVKYFTTDDPFIPKEVSEAVKQVRDYKACGIDEVPIEVFKYSDELNSVTLDIASSCFRSGSVPSILKDVVITILFKKGDDKCLDNYRGTALISHVGKVIERMIFSRLYPVAEVLSWLPESQSGLRSKRSTVDSILTSKVVSSLCKENGTHCYKIYTDLVKAYDKVNQEVLWMILERKGVPSKLLNLVKDTMTGSKARVSINGKLSDPFFLKCGLKQGSVISPLLFNIFFGAIIEEIEKRTKGLGLKLVFKVGGDTFDTSSTKKKKDKDTLIVETWSMLLADDAELCSDSKENLQSTVSILSEVVTAFGQEVSC